MAKTKNTKSSRQAQARKSAEREYRRKAKLLDRAGIYSPELKKGKPLSEWQKRQISENYRANQQYIDPKPGDRRYALVKPKDAGKKALKQFTADADSIRAKATRKGIFVELHPNTVKVEAVFDPSLKRYRVDEYFKNKRGQIDMRGKIVADADTLRLVENRLKRKSQFAKNVPKGKAIFYMIDGVRVFNNVFPTLDDAIKGIMQYVSERSLGQQIAFMNSISLFVADVSITPEEYTDMEAWDLVIPKGKGKGRLIEDIEPDEFDDDE